MEVLSQVWVWIVGALGGVTLTGILSAIIYGCLRGAFNKTISKINVEKIADKATDKGVDRVKHISFKHNIQPIVESELKKITENANEYLKKQIEVMQAQYNNLLEVLIKLSAYFDNSIGVSEQAKEELHNALDNARIEPVLVESVVDSEIVLESTEQPKEATKNAPKTLIER